MNYILTDARIMTMAPGTGGFAQADSLLVENGRIKSIGSKAECLSSASRRYETISLQHKVLLPAFCDTHTHFVELAKGRFQLKLKGLNSIAAIKEAAQSYRDTNAKLPDWVLGDGWDINIIDAPQYLNRKLLDELFPDVPVALFSKDYHSKWCNSLALKHSGLLDALNSPFGDDLVKRDEDGLATGLIYEAATEYLERFVSPPSDKELQKAIKQELAHIFSLGLGGFHSMESGASAAALTNAMNAGANFRCVWHFPLADLDQMITQGVTSYREQKSFIIGGVKIFADGALGSKTAAMLQPYPEEPSNFGVLRYNQDELDAIIVKAAKHNIACTIHAIGDLAVRNVIQCFYKHRISSQGNLLLQRIEHLQAIATEDLVRLQKSGAYCAMQPVHLANDVPMIEQSWRKVKDRAYRFHDILRLGIPYGFGSDAPIETIDPFKGIYSAIARKPCNDPSQPSWLPKQRIGVLDALRGYTLAAAAGSLSHVWRGSLEPGKVADIIAIEDWSGKPDEFWLEQRCSFCMVDGHINHIEL